MIKTKFKCKVFLDREGAVAAAKLGLKQRLYVSGWDLSYALREFIEGTYDGFVILAYDEAEKPVGILYGENEYGMIMLFVRKAERRQGIGTLLYCAAANILKDKIDNDFGIDGSYPFFRKMIKENSFRKTKET